MVISKQVLDAYFNAIFNCSNYFDNTRLKEFARDFPNEYKQLSSFYRARTKIRESIYSMLPFGCVYWFSLTYDDKLNETLESTRLKYAEQFLNDIFLCWIIVEEYGEKNGRYHIHGFGLFRDGKGFNDFRKWPCYQYIKELKNDTDINKKVRYLTNYMVKSLPKVRRNKNLVYLWKAYKKAKGFLPNFDCLFYKEMNIAFTTLLQGL